MAQLVETTSQDSCLNLGCGSVCDGGLAAVTALACGIDPLLGTIYGITSSFVQKGLQHVYMWIDKHCLPPPLADETDKTQQYALIALGASIPIMKEVMTLFGYAITLNTALLLTLVPVIISIALMCLGIGYLSTVE